MQWAFEDLTKLHQVVTALDEASKRNDLEFGSASLLVMESAGNILNAFHPMRAAADAVLRAVRGVPLQGAAPS